ncbi:excalibur calcium-binding domain-containing protein [Nocardia gipuzkoensis]|uniref:excalibur calcium-binding domain-containing protein n=1 Tax=Nocardia gipuzkoensis TaxID=2749991 RepID=UPI0030B7FC72
MTIRRRHVRALTALAAVTLPTVACGTDTNPPPSPPTSVTTTTAAISETSTLPRRSAPAPAPAPAPAQPPSTSSVYYPDCAAARAAGAAPMRRGEPGYRSDLDRNNNGIACE